jgi:hypothetical protein
MLHAGQPANSRQRRKASHPGLRNGTFLKFLRTVDRQVPKRLQIHMILDNYNPALTTTSWPGGISIPGSNLHFIPAPSSWLNIGRTLVPRVIGGFINE